MSENRYGGGFVPFVLGGLVVAVAVMGYFLFVEPATDESVDITISEEGVSVD